MEGYKFYNVEILDGYFSGVLYLYEEGKRFILFIGYDVELEKLTLLNCDDVMFNSDMEKYSNDEIADLWIRHRGFLICEIKNYINEKGNLIYADYPC